MVTLTKVVPRKPVHAIYKATKQIVSRISDPELYLNVVDLDSDSSIGWLTIMDQILPRRSFSFVLRVTFILTRMG